MGKQTNYESKNAKKSLEDISMMSCCLIAIAMTVVVMADPSQAMPSAIDGSSVVRRSEKPQSTLIAFPRVGRSVSDQEYYMFNDEREEASPSEARDSKLAGSKTRSKRQALIPFPRTGKRSLNHRAYTPVHHSSHSSSALMGRDIRGESALIPYPRTGKRAFTPRIGKRTPLPFFFASRNGNTKRVFAPRTGKRAFAPRTGKRAFAPRTGKRSLFYSQPGVGEEPTNDMPNMPLTYASRYSSDDKMESDLSPNAKYYTGDTDLSEYVDSLAYLHKYAQSPDSEDDRHKRFDSAEDFSVTRNNVGLDMGIHDLGPEDIGLTEAVKNNDLYQFLHSVLREVAKTQQLNGLNNFGEY